jgi:hypothetical protein
MPDVEQKGNHTSGFSMALMLELMSHTYNFYGIDNWDVERFGRYRNRLANSMFVSMNTLLKKVGICLTFRRAESVRLEELMRRFGHGLTFLYDLLEDDYSKDILTKVIAYRLLGCRKMKLPLNRRDYWEKRRKAFRLIKRNKALNIGFMNWSLKYFELDDIGYPIKLYSRPASITTTFMQHQYAYSKISSIKVQKGDYVIDAGGCWGDTALSFAHEVGACGRVYSFEFVPENLEIIRRNLELNPDLKKRIEIFHNALWSSSKLTDVTPEKCTIVD